MRASDFVNSNSYPAVWRFLETQVEMQFADLRVMLQMPFGDSLTAGCNFAATAVLLHLLSGFSVCLYEANSKSLASRRDRGIRFKKLLETYYPWEEEEYSPCNGSEWLYNVVRNPIAHSLGVQATSVAKWMGIAKRSLSLGEVQKLETDPQRPVWLGPGAITIFRQEVSSGEVGEFLSVPCLYWGTWRVLERLCQDADQMDRTELLLTDLGFQIVS